MEKKDRPMPLPRSDKGVPCIGQPPEKESGEDDEGIDQSKPDEPKSYYSR